MKRKITGKRNANRVNILKPKSKLTKDSFDWSKSGEGDIIVSESEDEVMSDTIVDEEIIETADEKRIRLAKEYLEKLHERENDDDDNEENTVSMKLQQDAMEASGKAYKKIADKLTSYEFDYESSRVYRGHKRPLTCVALQQDDSNAFTASKDGVILRWNVETGQKTQLKFPKDDDVCSLKDYQKCILSISVSTDGKFLVSGGSDKLVRVWDLRSNELIESFKGHRDTISSVAFRLNSTSVFTGSFDRTIKHWNLTEMGYVESLFGHQSNVNGLDSLYKERIVSCGGDNTVRMWKIAEDSQLVFHGKAGSIDTVKMINDEYYCSGSDTGSLYLWNTSRKKPIFMKENAHGIGNWISSLASLHSTDLLASGSCDGFVRLWKTDLDSRLLDQVGEIPIEGFVNGLAFAKSGRFLASAVGQEHRLGRWSTQKKARNSLVITALPQIDLT